MSVGVSTDIEAVLLELRAELSSIRERLDHLEDAFREKKPPAAAAPRPKAEPTPQPEMSEPISEEDLLAISAALAAYFGVKPHIRQIRLISSPAWAQQGRVFIMASHHLH